MLPLVFHAFIAFNDAVLTQTPVCVFIRTISTPQLDWWKQLLLNSGHKCCHWQRWQLPMQTSKLTRHHAPCTIYKFTIPTRSKSFWASTFYLTRLSGVSTYLNWYILFPLSRPKLSRFLTFNQSTVDSIAHKMLETQWQFLSARVPLAHDICTLHICTWIRTRVEYSSGAERTPSKNTQYFSFEINTLNIHQSVRQDKRLSYPYPRQRYSSKQYRQPDLWDNDEVDSLHDSNISS